MWNESLVFVIFFVHLMCSLAFPNISPQQQQFPDLRRLDKRGRYLDTYVVKNTEVHYHLPNEQAQYNQQLLENGNNPLAAFYPMHKSAYYPLMNQQQQMYYLSQPGAINIPGLEGENQGSSAVAQSCNGAICVNMRSGFR
ncbi:uncharacterized protein [Periplaneta americana]|uniref:uncharacterized protein n=1 Tax=Periplaneta americana TaxID=6978 RepID=UPI0037E95A61